MSNNTFILLDCPFCGNKPNLPDGNGTQYEIECDCDCLRCGKTLSAVEVDRLWREYANTITTQLDNEAALFNEPNDFDVMSEKHRSPSCKCHEFPIDAELKPDSLPKRFNADYAQCRGLKFYATKDTETDPNSQHFIIRFDDGGREDIQLKCSEAEAIIHWENLSFQWNCYLFELKKVEHLKGEQGE